MPALTSPSAGMEHDLVSLSRFHVVIWILVAICTLMCASRLYIRFSCFRRLLVDDYVMLFAWAMLLSTACVGQVYLGDVYMLMAVSRGLAQPGANFIDDARNGLRAFGIFVVLSYLGIWAVKINFLLFFKRLGYQVKAYTNFWWVILVITLAALIAEICLFQYRCMFGPMEYIIAVCPKYATIKRTYANNIASCIIDGVTDILIILFPTVILWKARVGLRKKVILGGIFSLVLFTIAITVARGSIFGGIYRSLRDSEQLEFNVTWLWFWFFMEHSISLIIASLVSFRALFVRKTNAQNRQPPQQSPDKPGLRQRVRRIHDSLLQSFKATETIDGMALPYPASGSFSGTFIADIEQRHATSDKEPSVAMTSSSES